MRRLRVAALAVLLLTPSAASADTFSTWSFHVTFGGELAADFGMVPFQVSAPLVEQASSNCCVSGAMFDLVSGPLLDLSVDGSGTHYTYDAGTLTITLSAFDENDNLVTGTLTAPVLPFSFTVCEECDHLFGGGRVYDGPFIDFGPGLFDPEFAEAMHLRPAVGVGSFDPAGLEAVRGTPDSELRYGFSPAGFAPLDIFVTEVPEPSLLVMLTAGIAAIVSRRGTSRARTSARR